MPISFVRPSLYLRGSALAGSFVALAIVCGLSGCAPADVQIEQLVGDWRAVLDSPGGELPFTLTVENDGGWLRAVAQNGEERAPFSNVAIDGRTITFELDFYDAEISAEMQNDGKLKGNWRKTADGGESSTLPFIAEKGSTERFLPASADGSETAGSDAVTSVDGNWSVTFTDEDGQEPARAELRQQGSNVTGTFLTPTGDYRFLDGSYARGRLRLSTFDGAHAFLFHATAQADGSLKGDFWSRDSYHATWTATPITEEDAEGQDLPDPWQLVGLTNEEGTFSFSFPDTNDNVVSLDDPRFKNKVVLVNIFGTWCPNCNDEAPLLSTWYRRFRDQGLEVVGLAYEYTGDPERDSQMVERFAERYSIQYPLLLAGTSDKEKAAETLPDLTSVVAFPTTVFIGRDGKVRKIHSGFSGPGTGKHHAQLVAELEGLIRELLAERP